MQTAVLETIDDPSLRAYVVWVPVLPDDSRSAAAENAALVTDARATHFWDEQRLLPPLFARVLELPEGWPAWDVYLAYQPGVLWNDLPPAPSFWHHQLAGLTAAPWLDGAVFAEQVRALVARSPT